MRKKPPESQRPSRDHQQQPPLPPPSRIHAAPLEKQLQASERRRSSIHTQPVRGSPRENTANVRGGRSKGSSFLRERSWREAHREGRNHSARRWRRQAQPRRQPPPPPPLPRLLPFTFIVSRLEGGSGGSARDRPSHGLSLGRGRQGGCLRASPTTYLQTAGAASDRFISSTGPPSALSPRPVLPFPATTEAVSLGPARTLAEPLCSEAGDSDSPAPHATAGGSASSCRPSGTLIARALAHLRITGRQRRNPAFPPPPATRPEAQSAAPSVASSLSP